MYQTYIIKIIYYALSCLNMSTYFCGKSEGSYWLSNEKKLLTIILVDYWSSMRWYLFSW